MDREENDAFHFIQRILDKLDVVREQAWQCYLRLAGNGKLHLKRNLTWTARKDRTELCFAESADV